MQMSLECVHCSFKEQSFDIVWIWGISHQIQQFDFNNVETEQKAKLRHTLVTVFIYNLSEHTFRKLMNCVNLISLIKQSGIFFSFFCHLFWNNMYWKNDKMVGTKDIDQQQAWISTNFRFNLDILIQPNLHHLTKFCKFLVCKWRNVR